jgi:glutamate-1-semialdehyde 2,1-aminomutase
MSGSGSDNLYERAQRVLPGGVTAGARANPALGRPFYVARARGPLVEDMDGTSYVDMCMSNGATLLGHGHPAIASAVTRALELGVACAYDGEHQVALAERLTSEIPSFEQVRFTGSGTEAVFYALRIARAYTGRTRVLKFEGHFHGFGDSTAFNFWPKPSEPNRAGALTLHAETVGLPADAAQEIIVLPFNDVDALAHALDVYGDQTAAVIMEPINFDSGAIMPDRRFLDLVRSETARRGIVLIFDEILSAYRTGPDGAQGYLGVTPDLSIVGKAIGGGLPLSVLGGRRDLMQTLSPVGPAVHTGTYSANLVPVLASLAFLEVIAKDGFFKDLIGVHDRLIAGLRAAFAEAGLAVRVQGVGARFGMYFGLPPDEEVWSYGQASRHDQTQFQQFCRLMHGRRVYCAPAWHHGVSASHTVEQVDAITEAAAASARRIADAIE